MIRTRSRAGLPFSVFDPLAFSLSLERLWSTRRPSPNPLCCKSQRRTRASGPGAPSRARMCPTYPDSTSSKGGTRKRRRLSLSSGNDGGDGKRKSSHSLTTPRLIINCPLKKNKKAWGLWGGSLHWLPHLRTLGYFDVARGANASLKMF